LSPLLGVISRIEAGQQALTATQQTLTAEVRALSAQAQSPSRAQDGERAWQLCPDQSEGLPSEVIAAAFRRASERGARVSAEMAARAIIPQSELDAMVATLPKSSWELELIVLVTPYLRAVIQHLAVANDFVLVNSEVYAWIQTPLENRKLWQKPDLFLCHRSAYEAADPPGQDSENAQWCRAIERMKTIGADQFSFGRCAWPLRDVMECFFEGKRQRLSLHEATGECLAKARNLLYRSADERSFLTPRQMVKCVMFDLSAIYLLQFDNGPVGGLASVRKFGWSTPGSFVTLLDFLQAPASLTPNWLHVLRSANARFHASLDGPSCFLGHGGMGRVFRVVVNGAPQLQYALKVVEWCSAEDRISLLEAELQHVHKFRRMVTDPTCLALLPSSPDDDTFVCYDEATFPPRPCGAAVRFTPAGQCVTRRFAKERPQALWRAVSSALWRLHQQGCFHGDARLENIVLVPKFLPQHDGPAASTRSAPTVERVSWQLSDAQLVWIDFRESSTHPQRRALDCLTCLCSFFRIPLTTRHPQIARLVSDYEQACKQLSSQEQAAALDHDARVQAAFEEALRIWQDGAWQALGLQPGALA
jgi:hypothetical protein